MPKQNKEMAATPVKKSKKTYTKTQVGRAIAPWALIVVSVAFIAGAVYGNWSTNNTNERIKSEAAALVSELKTGE